MIVIGMSDGLIPSDRKATCSKQIGCFVGFGTVCANRLRNGTGPWTN
jgi:hypothetical protein